jgi:hypothetical protein
MSRMLEMIDTFICACIGLDSDESRLNKISKVSGNLLISNTEPYKRHLHAQKIEDFLESGFNKLSIENKAKLGLAIGKSMAKNLTILFGGTELNQGK